MNRFKGILPNSLMEHYVSAHPKTTHENFVQNMVPLESFLSVSSMLCPDFIVIDDLVLLDKSDDFFISNTIRKRYDNNKKDLERYYNLFSLGEFYLNAADDSLGIDELFFKFGATLEYFWERRLQELFPEKKFEFEIAEKIMDEDNYCMTFSQIRL